MLPSASLLGFWTVAQVSIFEKLEGLAVEYVKRIFAF